jgi:RNA 2',3'-cyclic 3'-phosphodiesterase
LAEKRRLFFALWPDSDTRAGIVERREMLGSISRRRVPDHNLHLTLLFLGDQPADRVSDIQLAADPVAGQFSTLMLDRLGWFPGARVAWLGGEAPAALNLLVDRLKSAMQALDLRFDQRPFRPHVTLFRQVRKRPDLPAIEPLNWPVAEFALIESTPSQPYQVLRTWSVE